MKERSSITAAHDKDFYRREQNNLNIFIMNEYRMNIMKMK